MNAHKYDAHPEHFQARLPCILCGKTFLNENTLAVHSKKCKANIGEKRKFELNVEDEEDLPNTKLSRIEPPSI